MPRSSTLRNFSFGTVEFPSTCLRTIRPIGMDYPVAIRFGKQASTSACNTFVDQCRLNWTAQMPALLAQCFMPSNTSAPARSAGNLEACEATIAWTATNSNSSSNTAMILDASALHIDAWTMQASPWG